MPEDKPAKCKFCGESGFTWRYRPDGTWQMIDPETNTKHECPSAARYYANEKRMEEQKKEAAQRYRDNREGYL